MEDFIGCLVAIVVSCLYLFITPAILNYTWNLIAVSHFGLATLSYWEMFWGVLSLRLLSFTLKIHNDNNN